jgi:hypothetical protein
MKILISMGVALLTLVFNTCSPSLKEREKNFGSQKDFIVVENGSQCAIKTEKQLLINSKEEFEKIWNENFSLFIPVPALPEIDFSKKMVIAAWLGEVNKGGYNIDIQSINIEKEIMTITIKHIQPGRTCMSTMAIEQPFLFASTDKFPVEKTKFKTVKEIKECN